MTMRFLTAASVLALLTACSGRPTPPPVSPTEQGYNAYRVGDYAAAEAAYGSALAANRSNQTAMLGLAEVYESTGRRAEAAALYREVRAARSGTIRVWNDGRAMQDGVYEVATRRLGVMNPVEAPMTPAPTTYAPTPIPTQNTAPAGGYWAEDPVYGLDQNGDVFYADPQSSQSISTPAYSAPVAPMPSYDPYRQSPNVAAPTVYQPEPLSYAPAPIEYTTTPSAPQRPQLSYTPAPIQYEAAPISYTPAPIQYEAAPAPYQPAPVQYQPAPVQYQPAPVSYQPAPAPQYTPAPASYQPAAPTQFNPAPVTYSPAPVLRQNAPTAAPTPVVARRPSPPVFAPSGSAPVGQPGYTVVDGNFVYISAEDIAAGATPPTPTPAGPAADGYGVPVPVTSSPIPVGTPGTYSAPRGVDVQNGITIPNLN